MVRFALKAISSWSIRKDGRSGWLAGPLWAFAAAGTLPISHFATAPTKHADLRILLLRVSYPLPNRNCNLSKPHSETVS